MARHCTPLLYRNGNSPLGRLRLRLLEPRRQIRQFREWSDSSGICPRSIPLGSLSHRLIPTDTESRAISNTYTKQRVARNESILPVTGRMGILVI
jgi:hypothetical protein